MGNLRACLAVAVFGLGACGDDGGSAKQIDASIDSPSPDAKIFMDAAPPTFDFTCSSNTTAPTTATAMVTLGGTVQGLTVSGLNPSIGPVDAAALKACDATAANCTGQNSDGNGASDAQGNWSIANITTGSTPLNDYVEMTKTGWRTTYTYPASPFVADQTNIPVLTFDSLAESALSGFFSCDTSQALIGLALVDCMDNPVTDTANVTITVKQNGTTVTGLAVKDLGLLQPEAAGTFLVCGVPANAATEISAVYKTTNFLAHSVKTVTGTTTATILRPGY
jgi:hypothetical protein